MEDCENQIPVTMEEMPAEPGHGVDLEDERQDTQIGDGHKREPSIPKLSRQLKRGCLPLVLLGTQIRLPTFWSGRI